MPFALGAVGLSGVELSLSLSLLEWQVSPVLGCVEIYEVALCAVSSLLLQSVTSACKLSLSLSFPARLLQRCVSL